MTKRQTPLQKIRIARPFLEAEAASQGFLCDLEPVDLECRSALAVTGRFDTDRFHDVLFERLGIVCPDTLSKAVRPRRATFLAGRTLVRAGMAALGAGQGQVAVGADRAPIWPWGTTGSITHARSRCAVLIATEAGALAGIDIEEIAQGAALDTIFESALGEAETELIRSEAALPFATAATLVFSAKETLFKALYPRIERFFGFDHASLAGQPAQDRLTLKLTQPLDCTFGEGSSFDVRYSLIEGYVLTWLYRPDGSGSPNKPTSHVGLRKRPL